MRRCSWGCPWAVRRALSRPGVRLRSLPNGAAARLPEPRHLLQSCLTIADTCANGAHCDWLPALRVRVSAKKRKAARAREDCVGATRGLQARPVPRVSGKPACVAGAEEALGGGAARCRGVQGWPASAAAAPSRVEGGRRGRRRAARCAASSARERVGGGRALVGRWRPRRARAPAPKTKYKYN